MQIPEELRCCICLSPPDQALLTRCPHRVCISCVDSGGLEACPVCRAEFPTERLTDESFHRHMSTSVLRCECGAEMPVLEAESHSCESTRKRKRPEVCTPMTTRRPPSAPNRSTFACPLCDERNLTSQGLLEHCERMHANTRGPVVATCPICLAMPWGDPSYVSRDFLSHLRLRHRCDYAVLADFEADEEAMVRRALQDSMRTAGYSEELDEDERMMAQVLQQSAREASDAAARAEADASAGSDMTDTSSSATEATSAAEVPCPDDHFFDENEDESVTSESESPDNLQPVSSLVKATPESNGDRGSIQSVGAIGGVAAVVEVAQPVV